MRVLPSLVCGMMLIWPICCGADPAGATAKSEKIPGAGTAAFGNPPRSLNDISGVVEQTLNASDYTYVLVNTGESKKWAVAPKFEIKVGDTVIVAGGVEMTDYYSKTLNRAFDVVYFTGTIRRVGASAALRDTNSTHPEQESVESASPHEGGACERPKSTPAKIDYSGIKKLARGKTIAELFAQKDNLAGKNITLRAKIVKASYGIMNKAWLHLRDGTGSEGTNDLIVTTTSGSPKVGQIVLVKGVLQKEKNIGQGYVFPLIVENAKVTIESAKR